ncbi:MAG: hypothetical protein ACR2PW_05805 [Gammaproteobacteria bacterium]
MSSLPQEANNPDELWLRGGQYRSTQDLWDFLLFVIKFRNLAPFNAYLLHTQKPGSTYVASDSDWGYLFKRRVNPEARPLIILHPFGPVRFVFDVSDTQGEQPLPEALFEPIQPIGEVPSEMFDQLVANLPRVGISYHEADYAPDAAGLLKHDAHKEVTQKVGEKSVRIRFRLIVNQHYSRTAKFCTIARALGHIFCKTLPEYAYLHKDKWRLPSMEISARKLREFSAESVCWLVCERAGLKSEWHDLYLKTYFDRNSSIAHARIEAIMKAAGKVEAMMVKTIAISESVKVPKNDLDQAHFG